MKVLFITHDGISHETLGLEYLSASLMAAGHETMACMQSRVRETVGSWRPDFAAFQVLTGDERRWGSVARTIKDEFPGVRTIFGGPHFLFFNSAQQPEADFVVRGDGERAIVDIVEGRKHLDFVPIEPVDLKPMPDRRLFYNDDFPGIKNNVIRNFIATIGCPYKCTYCFNSNENWQAMVEKGKKRLRYHSPEYMVEDIGRTMRDFGGDLVSFQDDIFGIDMAWLERFTELYKNLGYPFFAQLRPRLITEDRIALLKEAGVHIVSFAIESGNQRNRQEVLDRDEPNELIERGCELLHKHGIKFRMQNLLGLPVEDPLADALETLRFNIKCRPTLSWCSLLQAYAGTKIADLVLKMGVVKSIEELNNQTQATFFDEMSLPVRDKARIERLHKYWSAVVRWPWLYWLVTKVMINVNFGRKFHNWIFDAAKSYINSREYWRVERMESHLSVLRRNEGPLDRLGGELVRNPEKVCA